MHAIVVTQVNVTHQQGFLMQVGAISSRGLLGLSEGQMIDSLCQNIIRDNMCDVLSV